MISAILFDNICKFLAETYSADLATWLLGEPIQLTQVQPQELAVELIRADSLILLVAEGLLLHLEFQTKCDRQISTSSATKPNSSLTLPNSP